MPPRSSRRSTPSATARLLRILGDSARVARRKRRHGRPRFRCRGTGLALGAPGYYRRNFHYQTDGYLSERSADLYEHQVELLRGGADAMRRLVLAPDEGASGGDPCGLRLLELGSGTGGANALGRACLPEARITCIDLSPPYTRFAREQLRGFRRVECLQGDAADLRLRRQTLRRRLLGLPFHELPLPRQGARARGGAPGAEARRLRSRRLAAAGRRPELDWAPDVFPREFHGALLRALRREPDGGAAADAGFEAIESSTGYLAKCIAARAPTTAGTDQSGR
ncbi:MAG: class I SAM-dependent methyltransferase [Myxococcota bacterium]